MAKQSKTRAQADIADPLQVAAPIPGLIVTMSASVGAKVAKGDRLFMMEAMKMLSPVEATGAARVVKIHIENATLVARGDPLFTLEPLA